MSTDVGCRSIRLWRDNGVTMVTDPMGRLVGLGGEYIAVPMTPDDGGLLASMGMGNMGTSAPYNTMNSTLVAPH